MKTPGQVWFIRGANDARAGKEPATPAENGTLHRAYMAGYIRALTAARETPRP